MIRTAFGDRGRRQGAMDGLNLFFGALLGANLGTLEGLKLVHYVEMIALLAVPVMGLRMLSTVERRRSVLPLLAAYAAILAVFAASPGLRPEGVTSDALSRLVATMAVWTGLALAIELSPEPRSADPSPPQPGDARPPAPRPRAAALKPYALLRSGSTWGSRAAPSGRRRRGRSATD